MYFVEVTDAEKHFFAADFMSANKEFCCAKNESYGDIYYQTTKLGTQSKLYE